MSETQAATPIMRTPKLFWVCAVYLVFTTTVTGSALYLSFSHFIHVEDKITSLIAITAYALGTIAFMMLRKISVPLLALGFIVGVGGLLLAILTRGLGPHFAHPYFLVGRAISVCFLAAVIGYVYSLARRGFLR
jgi:hypothetical protein